MSDYVKFLSESVEVFGYFGEIFDYGSQFSLRTRDIRKV